MTIETEFCLVGARYRYGAFLAGSPQQLCADLSRFTFLLGGSHGEYLVEPGQRGGLILPRRVKAASRHTPA
jgi:hypothetical protein